MVTTSSHPTMAKDWHCGEASVQHIEDERMKV
jgi:hypothetical protein